MRTIRQLQAIVNDISDQLDRIDTPEKLRKAKQMADKMEKGDLLTIVYQALDYRFTADLKKTTTEFLAMARR